MWTHCQPAVSASNMDLDAMFDFLKEERAEVKAGQAMTASTKAAALESINEEFDTLDELWKEAEKVSALFYY